MEMLGTQELDLLDSFTGWATLEKVLSYLTSTDGVICKTLAEGSHRAVQYLGPEGGGEVFWSPCRNS